MQRVILPGQHVEPHVLSSTVVKDYQLIYLSDMIHKIQISFHYFIRRCLSNIEKMKNLLILIIAILFGDFSHAKQATTRNDGGCGKEKRS